MSRPPSTLRSLIPFTTTSPVQDAPYVDSLPDGSPFRPFAETVDDYDRYPKKYPKWGVYDAQEMIHDEGAPSMPRTALDRGAKDKIKPSVIEGFSTYISAMLLYDTMVRLSPAPHVGYAVLRHPKQVEWIGDSKLLTGLKDVRHVITHFSSNRVSFPHGVQEEGVDKSPNADYTTRLASDIVTCGRSKEAFVTFRNFASLALNVRIMSQGFIHVPLNYQEVGFDVPAAGAACLAEVMAKPKRLRQVLLLAVCISPLVLLLGEDLLEMVVCIEETLLNCKALGNEKPASVRTLEDDVWNAVFDIALGRKTTYSAVNTLRAKWESSNVVQNLTAEDVAFFDRSGAASVSSDSRVSLYSASPRTPLPAHWPLPPAAVAAISGVTSSDDTPTFRAADTGVPSGGSPVTDDNPGVPNEETDLTKGERKSERQAKNPLPPNAYANAQGKAPPKKTSGGKGSVPKKSEKGGNAGKLRTPRSTPIPRRRRKRVRKSQPTVPLEEGDSGEEDDVVEIIDYSLLRTADSVHRKHLGDELVVKLEESDNFMNPIRNGVLAPLEVDEVVPRYSDSRDRVFPVWDASGTRRGIRPFFHLQADYEAWEKVFEHSYKHHVRGDPSEEGLPLFVATPDESSYRCMPYEEHQRQPVGERQALIGRQNPVITGVPGLLMPFQLPGLETVGDLQASAEFHDQSIPVKDDFSTRMRLASLNDVFENSQGPLERRKSLNGLNFPNDHVGVQPSPFATDERAVRRTKNDAGCSKSILSRDIVFALVATEGAMSWWHEDAHGEATRLRIVAGWKLWAIAEPLDARDISSTKFWTDENLDLRNMDLSKFRVEMILLRPGDELFMRPGTKHAVLTLQNCIVHGNYFLPTSCLSRTVCGMVHTFFEARIATNASHGSFNCRMNSIAAYIYKCVVKGERIAGLDDGYLPDFSTGEGLKNFIIFACGIELQQALSRESYETTTDDRLLDAFAAHGITPDIALERFDISSCTHEARVQNVYSRGRVKHTLMHVLSRIRVLDTKNSVRDPWEFLFTPALAWFILGLKDYYRRSSLVTDTANDTESPESNVNPDDVALPDAMLFQRQLDFCVGRWPKVEIALRELETSGTPVSHFILDWPEFTVQPSDGELCSQDVSKSNSELFSMGTSDGDIVFFSAHAYYRQRIKRKREVNEDGNPDKEEDQGAWLTAKELQQLQTTPAGKRSKQV